MTELKVGSKEFHDLMIQFEKDISLIIYGHDFSREKPGAAPKGIYYCDGYVNTLFQAYMTGYQYHRYLTL